MLTPLSTQPGVARVFATVAETEHGGQGIVYIANSRVLAGASLEEYFPLPYEFQIVLNNVTPLEFVNDFVSDSVSAAGARQILCTLGVNIDSRISLTDQSGILISLAQRPLTKSQILTFVQMARTTP